MQRQLKFRVWDKLENRFIYPDKGYQGHYVLDLNGKFHNLQNGSGGDEYVVQQFIGVLDKQGKEIFEGDLVNYLYQLGEHDTEHTQGEVYFEDGIFYFDRSYEWAMNDVCFISKSLEVIGNIFELKQPL